MKKVLSIAVMMIFVAGMAMAQTTPASAKKSEKKGVKMEAKADVKKDTVKKAPIHKQPAKKLEKKAENTKK
jgi:hypothetical protein